MSERLNTDKIGVLTRALERERKARVIAEELIEKRQFNSFSKSG